MKKYPILNKDVGSNNYQFYYEDSINCLSKNHPTNSFVNSLNIKKFFIKKSQTTKKISNKYS